MELMEQIATNAADYAVSKFGMHLDKRRQLRLWKRHYDGVLSSLITYEELDKARRIRTMAFISEN